MNFKILYSLKQECAHSCFILPWAMFGFRWNSLQVTKIGTRVWGGEHSCKRNVDYTINWSHWDQRLCPEFCIYETSARSHFPHPVHGEWCSGKERLHYRPEVYPRRAVQCVLAAPVFLIGITRSNWALLKQIPDKIKIHRQDEQEKTLYPVTFQS